MTSLYASDLWNQAFQDLLPKLRSVWSDPKFAFIVLKKKFRTSLKALRFAYEAYIKVLHSLYSKIRGMRDGDIEIENLSNLDGKGVCLH